MCFVRPACTKPDHWEEENCVRVSDKHFIEVVLSKVKLVDTW